jgi:hypothetical protein
MSVRVNLLPHEAAERQEAIRQRQGVGVAAVALLAVLGAVYLWQVTQVNNAEAERDQAREELQALEARETQLSDFAELEQRVEESNDMLSTALADEISFAGILQDVAAVTPTDTAYDEFTVTAVEAAGPDGEEVRQVIARIVASGESLFGHAPGLERVMLELDKIGSFFDVYFTNSEIDEDDPDVTFFDLEVDVGVQARTDRYEQGVPEELR